jgi:hypothetical protein
MLPILLFSTSDLVTLNLFDVPILGYISPKRMVACLAALPKLEVFAITCKDIDFRPPRIRPPPVTRPILPALTKFQFRGVFEYLEDLVAQIDAPQLERVSISYLDRPDNFQITQLSEFIDRSIGPELTPSRHAHVSFQSTEVTITLSRDYETYQGRDQRSIATTISHEVTVLDWAQVSDGARVLSQFSAALSTVVYLELEAKFKKEDAYSAGAYDVEWLHLLRHFPVMQALHVSSMELAVEVLVSLLKALLGDITAEMATEVLPSLGLIYLEGVPASSLEKIVTIRRFSDHPITVVETRDEFKERVKSYVSI